MFQSRIRIPLPALAAAVVSTAIVAGPALAQAPASITVDTQLGYQVTTLTITGTATCAGGGTAGVTVVGGSLEQMFQGGIGGPIAIQLDGPVLVDCDSTTRRWSGNLIAPGRALPNNSGGMLTVTLSQGANVIATTGEKPIYIVS